MVKKTLVLSILFQLFTLLMTAQNYQLGAAVSNNVTSWPVIGYPELFYSQLHPGLDIIFEKQINKKTKNQFWAEANLGGFYHRFFQTAVKLNAAIHYRYFFNPRVFTDVGIGGGYLHSFYHYEVFKLNSDGNYVKETGIKGRPQFVMGVCLGAGFGLKKSDPTLWRLLIQFRSNAQGIFSGSFVPVVPYNAFLVGVTHRLEICKKKNENTK